MAIGILTACSGHTYNPTTSKYQIREDLLKAHPLKKLVIATANLSGEPTRYHLQKGAVHVDAMVSRYLQQHGYKIAPSYEFENAWKQAIRTYGDMYDPTTGKVDVRTWQAVMVSTMKMLKETTDIDAIVFADVVESNSSHSTGMDHLAQWDGVSRKPKLASAGADGVPYDFNWSQNVRVASLVVTIYSTDMQGLFTGRGGLDVLDEINTKDKPRFELRKHILDNDDNIEEGIEIAFHPFIKMKDYPGNP